VWLFPKTFLVIATCVKFLTLFLGLHLCAGPHPFDLVVVLGLLLHQCCHSFAVNILNLLDQILLINLGA